MGRGEQAFPTSKKKGRKSSFWIENFGLIIILKSLRTTAFIKMFHGVLLPLVIVKKKQASLRLVKGPCRPLLADFAIENLHQLERI